MYHKPGCPFGIRLRAALKMRKVPYVAIRFRDDEAGAAQVRAANDGNEISSTVRVGDLWLTNPRWREVAASMSLAWLIWPTDGQDAALEAGAFRILSVESEVVAESVDQGKAGWTVTAKLTDVNQLRRLAIQAHPDEAAAIGDSLAVAWQRAADSFAPLRSIPGISWRPGQVDVEYVRAKVAARTRGELNWSTRQVNGGWI